jgi:hypothetical protein
MASVELLAEVAVSSGHSQLLREFAVIPPRAWLKGEKFTQKPQGAE